MSGRNKPAAGRLIVELSRADAAALRSAAELARWFGLHLHGVFVEDEALLALAEFPFAREFRLPAHDWAPFAAERLAEELRHAADQARGLMQQAVERIDVPNVFEVLRGDPAACIAGLCSPGDIVVLLQSAPGAAPTRLPDTMQGVRASVLLLPSAAASRNGPVVAVLRDAADPVLEHAAWIAGEQAERLVILLPATSGDDEPHVADRAAAAGLPRQRITVVHLTQATADAVHAALGSMRERLIVSARAKSGPGSPAETIRLVATRATPVLLLEMLEAD